MTPFRIVFSGLLPFAAGYFMSYLLRAVNAVVAPDLVKDVGLSPAQLGLLTAAYLGAFALFQLPLGVLLDRYGPRKVQAGLLSLAALGCLAFAFAPGFIGLFTARALIGLGFSAGLMASYKSSATWVPIERRSLVNTSIMAVGAMGVIVATEPTEYLVSLIGWRNTFAVFAGLIMLAAIFILSAAPRKDTVGAPAPLATQFAQMMAILKTPLFWRVAPLLGLTSGIQIGIQTLWAGPWFRDVMGFTREEVARHLLFMAIAFMVGILSAGVIADRLGRRGIGPMQVLLGFNVIYFIAQAIIVFRIEGLMFPAWLGVPPSVRWRSWPSRGSPPTSARTLRAAPTPPSTSPCSSRPSRHNTSSASSSGCFRRPPQATAPKAIAGPSASSSCCSSLPSSGISSVPHTRNVPHDKSRDRRSDPRRHRREPPPRGLCGGGSDTGHVVAAEGAIAAAVFPRSAVKAFQCLADAQQRRRRPLWPEPRRNRAVLRVPQWRARSRAGRPLHPEEGGQWRGPL